MSDDSARAALRSDAPLVTVEAPAGCGKTFQASTYAREIADQMRSGRPLVLTHTHAACSVFAKGTKDCQRRVEIRTIDSVIGGIASAYHAGLDLPQDVAGWVRSTREGHLELSARVARLLERYPMIGATLACRYPVVVCDEHQDSSADQHALVSALLGQGARVRIFADPMQTIFADRGAGSVTRSWNWQALTEQSDAFEELDTPHRWSQGCQHLGAWTLSARAELKRGAPIDLRGALPTSLSVVFAENQARHYMDYRLDSAERRPIDRFEREATSLLILTHHNDTAQRLRSFFSRRVLLWEGHRRSALETLVDAIGSNASEPASLAAAVTEFVNEIAVGFSASAFGNLLQEEAAEGCRQSRRGKPAVIQELARCLVDEPNHKGVAKLLRRVFDLKDTDSAFAAIKIDGHKEFWDAIRLGDFENAGEGLAQIAQQRSYSHPRPPARAISTVHKAKGLECDSVVLMPCDAKTFPDNPSARCLLYVALSRATHRLLIVASRTSPSPLLIL